LGAAAAATMIANPDGEEGQIENSKILEIIT
jgi:hypothetical protein